MRRLEHIVAPGEQVHLVTREHGVVLVRPFFRALGFVGLFGGAAYDDRAQTIDAVRGGGS